MTEEKKNNPLADHRMKKIEGILRQIGDSERQMIGDLQRKLNQGKPMGISLEQAVAKHVALVEDMNEAIASEYAKIRHRGISGSLTREALRRTNFPFERMSPLLLAFYGRWYADKMPSLLHTAKADATLMGAPPRPMFAPEALRGLSALRIGFSGDELSELGLTVGAEAHPVRAVHLMKSFIRIEGTDAVSVPLAGLSACETFVAYGDELSFLVPLICEAYESKSVELHPALAMWSSDGYGRTEFEMIPIVEDQTVEEMFAATTVAPPVDKPDAPVQVLSDPFIAIKKRVARILAMQPKQINSFNEDLDHIARWQGTIAGG